MYRCPTSIADHRARLRVQQRGEHHRTGLDDSSIAVTAVAFDVPLLTEDDRFPDTDGLTVTRV